MTQRGRQIPPSCRLCLYPFSGRLQPAHSDWFFCGQSPLAWHGPPLSDRKIVRVFGHIPCILNASVVLATYRWDINSVYPDITPDRVTEKL